MEPSQSTDLLNIDAADGIIRYSMEQLASDPSIILGNPAPGGYFFYVDQLLQIKVGSKIIFSTEAEHDPANVRAEMAQLFQAQKQRAKYPADSALWMDWDARCNRLGDSVQKFYEGQRRIKSLRIVIHTEIKQREGQAPIYLIAVNKPFSLGYKPRPLGAVLRVLGKETDLVDEIKTDRFHTALRKYYGSDWQGDFEAHGSHLLSSVGGGR